MAEGRLPTFNTHDLNDLMDGTLNHFNEKLQSFGGVDGLWTQILKTSPTSGLQDDDATNRRGLYKEIPATRIPEPVPSLGALIWTACMSRDLLLIRIQFCAKLILFILTYIIRPLIFLSWEEWGSIPVYIALCLIPVIHTFLPISLASILMGWTNHKLRAHFMGGVSDSSSDGVRVTVIRNGVTREGMLRSELVVGDICLLTPGTTVPANGVWMECDPVTNSPRDPRLYSGDFNRVGRGRMVVVSLAESPKSNDSRIEASLLADKLYSFSRFAIIIAVVGGILTTFVLTLRWALDTDVTDKNSWIFGLLLVTVPFGFHIFSLALPELIPLGIIISISLVCHRIIKASTADGVFLKSTDSLTTLSSATTLLVEIECLDNTVSASSSADIMKAMKSLRTAGIRVRILVSPNHSDYSNVKESLGLREEDFCVVRSSTAETIQSTTSDGENVTLLSPGMDSRALQSAHVGIVMAQSEEDCVTAGDIHLPKDDFRALDLIFRRGRRVYEDISSIFQLYIPALGVICVSEFTNVLTGYLNAFLRGLQLIWILAMIFTLSVGYTLSPETRSETRSSLEHPGLNLTSKKMRWNIVGQIIFQGAVVVILILILGQSFIAGSASGLMMNVIVWMTLGNAFNARKSQGELNIFRGLSVNDPFLWIWVICAILQVLAITFGGLVLSGSEINFYGWMACLGLGVGSLVCHQIVRFFAKCAGEDLITKEEHMLRNPYANAIVMAN